MTVGHYYQVKLHQTYGGQELLNVFWYGHSSGAGTLMAEALNDLVFNSIYAGVVQGLQDEDCICTRVETVDWQAPSDYFAEDFSQVGLAVAGVAQPSNVAVAFRSPKLGPGTRYGYKRFGGVKLVLDDTGEIDTLSHEVLLDDIATRLGLILTSAGNTFVPFQVRITAATPLGTPPLPRRGYVGNWTWNKRPGTQNSRKSYEWTAV